MEACEAKRICTPFPKGMLWRPAQWGLHFSRYMEGKYIKTSASLRVEVMSMQKCPLPKCGMGSLHKDLNFVRGEGGQQEQSCIL